MIYAKAEFGETDNPATTNNNNTTTTTAPPPAIPLFKEKQTSKPQRRSRIDLSTAVESEHSVRARQEYQQLHPDHSLTEFRRRLVRKASTFSLRTKHRTGESADTVRDCRRLQKRSFLRPQDPARLCEEVQEKEEDQTTATAAGLPASPEKSELQSCDNKGSEVDPSLYTCCDRTTSLTAYTAALGLANEAASVQAYSETPTVVAADETVSALALPETPFVPAESANEIISSQTIPETCTVCFESAAQVIPEPPTVPTESAKDSQSATAAVVEKEDPSVCIMADAAAPPVPYTRLKEIATEVCS